MLTSNIDAFRSTLHIPNSNINQKTRKYDTGKQKIDSLQTRMMQWALWMCQVLGVLQCVIWFRDSCKQQWYTASEFIFIFLLLLLFILLPKDLSSKTNNNHSDQGKKRKWHSFCGKLLWNHNNKKNDCASWKRYQIWMQICICFCWWWTSTNLQPTTTDQQSPHDHSAQSEIET